MQTVPDPAAARYSVLVFKSANLTDEQLVTFARTSAEKMGTTHGVKMVPRFSANPSDVAVGDNKI